MGGLTNKNFAAPNILDLNHVKKVQNVYPASVNIAEAGECVLDINAQDQHSMYLSFGGQGNKCMMFVQPICKSCLFSTFNAFAVQVPLQLNA